MASKDTKKRQRGNLNVRNIKPTNNESKESETGFGPDHGAPRKLSQGASPNPEHKRPAFKSMKHKVFKTFGLEKTHAAVQPSVEDQSSTQEEENLSSLPARELESSPENVRKRIGMSSGTTSQSEPVLIQEYQSSPESTPIGEDMVKQKSDLRTLTDHPLSQGETSPSTPSSPGNNVSSYRHSKVHIG